MLLIAVAILAAMYGFCWLVLAHIRVGQRARVGSCDYLQWHAGTQHGRTRFDVTTYIQLLLV